jgi:hypothetical protein
VVVTNNLFVYFVMVMGGYGTFLLTRQILSQHSVDSDLAAALPVPSTPSARGTSIISLPVSSTSLATNGFHFMRYA